MQNAYTTKRDSYSESEAASILGITLERLHQILDEHIFNDGTPRPAGMELRPSDLILIGFWVRSSGNPKVVRMPRR